VYELSERESTFSEDGFAVGRVSTGLIHATPGDMKSFRSSADRIALMIAVASATRRWVL
jgi:hypothetical protein